MGLDIIAGNIGFRAGSYSGFHEFREWLVQKIGYENFDDYWKKNEKQIGEFSHRNGMHKGVSKLSLGPLLCHSDCDGWIGPGNAKRLLEDLKDIKLNLEPIVDPSADEIWFREKLDDWIEACGESVEGKLRIEFS